MVSSNKLTLFVLVFVGLLATSKLALSKNKNYNRKDNQSKPAAAASTSSANLFDPIVPSKFTPTSRPVLPSDSIVQTRVKSKGSKNNRNAAPSLLVGDWYENRETGTLLLVQPTTQLRRNIRAAEMVHFHDIVTKWNGSRELKTANMRIDRQGEFIDSAGILPGKKWINYQVQLGGRSFNYQRKRGGSKPESTSLAQVFVPKDQHFSKIEYQSAFYASVPKASYPNGNKVWMFKIPDPAVPAPVKSRRVNG